MQTLIRSLAVVLLLVILNNLGGYHILYTALRRKAKSDMKSYISTHYKSDKGVVRFSFSESENFDWVDNKEFRYNGDMYDVVSSEITNGVGFIYCIKDTRENELISSYVSIRNCLTEKDGSTSPLHRHIKKLKKELSEPYYPHSVVIVNRIVHFGYYIPADSNLHFDVITPPPRA